LLCQEQIRDVLKRKSEFGMDGIQKFIKTFNKDKRRKVTIALKKIATRESTLKKMIGMNFKERCILLHRLYPEVMIKRTTLSRIYKEYKIKKKVIKKVKVIPECSRDWAERAKIECRERINQYR
jgi:alpha-galactosidase